MTKPEWWDWVVLGDNEGRVDRPSAVPAWSAPPEVELDRQWLLFRYPVRMLRHGKRALQFRRVKASAGLLTEFIALDEAPAQRVLAYARRHGPLGFCRHGDPSHRLRPQGCAAEIVITGGGQSAVREALQWWRNLAGRARALLNAAAQLFKGRVDDLTLRAAQPRGAFFGAAAQDRAARPGALRRLWDGTVAAPLSGAPARHLQPAAQALRGPRSAACRRCLERWHCK